MIFSKYYLCQSCGLKIHEAMVSRYRFQDPCSSNREIVVILCGRCADNKPENHHVTHDVNRRAGG